MLVQREERPSVLVQRTYGIPGYHITVAGGNSTTTHVDYMRGSITDGGKWEVM